jgi:hypothetical protein
MSDDFNPPYDEDDVPFEPGEPPEPCTLKEFLDSYPYGTVPHPESL